jgi:hypothetical protein
MSDIYVSKEDKKEIETMIQRGEKTSEKIDNFVKKITSEREINLKFMRSLRAEAS